MSRARRGSRSRLRSKPAARIFTFFAILLPLIPLRGLIVPSDSEEYLSLIAVADLMDTASPVSSKQYVALFYSQVDQVLPVLLFTNAVFVIYLWYLTLAVRTASAYVIAVIVTLPMYIHFDYVSKEAILGAIPVLGVLATALLGRRAGQVVFVCGVVLFAVFVRPYYAIPIVATAVLISLGAKRGAIALGGGFAVVCVFFPGPLQILEESRRQMYLSGVHVHGTRTAYPGVIIDDGIPLQLESIFNYFIVLFQTLFPLTWTFTLKDVFAQLFIISVLVLVVASMKCRDRLFSTFGVCLMLTVPFFSPDLGTSMRHIAAAALFVHLGIALRRIYNGGDLPFRVLQVAPVYGLGGDSGDARGRQRPLRGAMGGAGA